MTITIVGSPDVCMEACQALHPGQDIQAKLKGLALYPGILP